MTQVVLSLIFTLTACSSDKLTQLKTLEQENTRLKAQVDQLLEEKRKTAPVMNLIGQLANQVRMTPENYYIKLRNNITQSRESVRRENMKEYAVNVFKAAAAYVAEDSKRKLILGDCSQGYTAGDYSIDWIAVSTKCNVSGTEQSIKVEVVDEQGYRYTVP